jgi:diguanylate cyclase (GGDEF)-like protein
MDPLTAAHALAAAVALLAAVAMAVFGLTQRSYAGFGWWHGTLWLTAAALVAASAAPTGAAAILLPTLVAWPLGVLRGWRSFHARTGLPGGAALDGAVLAALLAVALWPLMAGSTPAGDPPRAAAALAALYAAAVLAGAPAGSERMAMRALAGVTLAVGSLPLAIALASSASDAAAASLPSALALASAFTAFGVMLQTTQRTERVLLSSQRKLRTLANLDMLTQVPNRRRFEELAQRALQADEPGSATLLLVDIDHFKHINDRLGHAAGDRALKLVSRCTQELLRAQDVAGRHGGDEFVLLLRRSSTHDAMHVAQRLVAQLQARSHAHALPRLSLSFGVVQMRPGESIEQTLQRADLALYEAKRLGRCRAVAADGDDDEHPVFRSSQRLGLTSS